MVNRPRTLGAIIVLLVAVYLVPLGMRSLWSPDETRYAEISREMIATGNWLVPRFLGLRYFEKPILGYWMNCVGQLVFGHDNFGVRIAEALSTLACAFLVFLLARRCGGGRATTLGAAAIFLSLILVWWVGTFAVLDAMLALWLAAAMVAFHWALDARDRGQRLRRYAVFGVCCGLGFLTKGFIALAVPVIAIAPYMLWCGRWRELVVWGWVAVGAAAIVAAPWSIAIHLVEPDFWHYFFWVQHIQRFAGRHAQHAAPWWYYLPVAALTFMPWTPAAPAAVRAALRADAPRRADAMYLLLWTILPLVFFSISRGKLATYILPCTAPFAVLLALGLERASEDAGAGPWRVPAFVNLAFAVLLAGGAIAYGLHVSHGRSLVALLGPTEIALLALALVAWAAIAWFARRRRDIGAIAAFALMPFGLMIAAPLLEPPTALFANAQQRFVEAQVPHLAPGTLLLANNVGLAAAIAWETRRTDITMFNTLGELAYGHTYPDGLGRLVTARRFKAWLATARPWHDVALFIRTTGNDGLDEVPPPDARIRSGRLLLLLYHRRS